MSKWLKVKTLRLIDGFMTIDEPLVSLSYNELALKTMEPLSPFPFVK